jgi:hypothetical protein
MMKVWVDRVGSSLRSMLDGRDEAAGSSPDLSRRAMLTGVAAVVVCGVAATTVPTPAGAQVEFHFGDDDDHSRRRSMDSHSRRRSMDEHSRRRSRAAHSRRRSMDHGRRRSRREFRDWNENCFPTPFGWMCM